MTAIYEPDFDTFCRLAQADPSVTVLPIRRTLTADALTPVTAYRLLDGGTAETFLFESVVGGERVGRYSFVGVDPFATLTVAGMQPQLALRRTDLPEWVEQALVRTKLPTDPFDALKELLNRFQAPHLRGLPRFCGGAVGYVAYDVVRCYEPLPGGPVDDRNLPDLVFSFYDRMIVFDHIQKTLLVIVHAHLPSERSTNALEPVYEQARRCLDELTERLQHCPTWLPPVDVPHRDRVRRHYTSNFSREAFEEAVEKCREYIKAGDIFQVVISQRLETRTTATPFEIYRALRVVNPSPFMFLLRTAGAYLIGASPEIMVRVEDRLVTTRPLAGTRPRGLTEEEDRRLAQELLADEKERAEHVMLVDLGRNDIGRVAEYGTVELSDLMTVERYSHVMHITSNVTGRLRPGLHALDALRACLPAGTVSGAPKVRAMQIIDEIEPHRRGPYAGAVGYVDFTGNMDTCIALRTMVMQGDRVHIQAGAGIVYDSVPAREYEETLNKAKGMLKAVELAETYLTAETARSRLS